MKTVFTAKEMAGVDSYAINDLGIPGLILMENAGRGVADIARQMLKQPNGKLVHIYCGAGNNGGDGYVVARHLFNHGARVRVLILAAAEKIAGDARVNLDVLQSMGRPVEFITNLPPIDEKPDLIIDAMLGTGVKGALRGLYAQAADAINAAGCPILAVDIPSGVNADTGRVAGPAVHAAITATMAAPKRGLLFSPGRECVGRLEIIDISMPPSVIEKLDSKVSLVDAAFVKNTLPRRAADAFKNRVGLVQVIAGATGFTGAAFLASTAVMRSGAGLSYLAVPKSLNAILENKLTEVITLPIDDKETGCFSKANAPALFDHLQDKDVVALGPGIGRALQTGALVHELLTSMDKPLVLDADGLNLCAGHTELIEHYAGDVILTPHVGELSRLTGLSTHDIIGDPIACARRYAQQWRCCIVLKGAPTVIAAPSGRVYINSTGNAGMATAGSGDVLTGIVAGLRAQGMTAEYAAVAGVYVHGLAGDLAAAEHGMMGMTAGDILQKTPGALKRLTGDVL